MAESEQDAQAAAGGESWIIRRPNEIVMELPYTYRWEVTRRHPYYLRFWQLARRRYECPSDDAEQRGLEESAALILLGALGVSATPPPPGDGPESLGTGSLGQSWEGGAVAPVTFRGLAGILLADLPPELLVEVGCLLTECGKKASQETVDKFRFLTQLHGLKHPALDALPGRPLVGVNVNAPQRVIAAAIETMVRKWKDQKGLVERRRRDDKLDDYLAVWDRREGWAGNGYDGGKEHTLRQICQQLQISQSTAANRYRSAFRLIFGREYSPALWARVLGIIKATEWLDPMDLPRRTLRRPWRDRQDRPVSEAALQTPDTGAGAAGLLNTVGVSQDEIAFTDLLIDIQDLIEQGRTTAEIVAALEMTTPAAAEMIDFLRQRREEQL